MNTKYTPETFLTPTGKLKIFKNKRDTKIYNYRDKGTQRKNDGHILYIEIGL